MARNASALVLALQLVLLMVIEDSDGYAKPSYYAIVHKLRPRETQWRDVSLGTTIITLNRTKRASVESCTLTSVLADAGAGAGIGSIGGPIGAGVGAAAGALFSGIKALFGDNGCTDTDDTAESLKNVNLKLDDVSFKIDNIKSEVIEGNRDNKINHGITQELVQQSARENQINFDITRDLINEGRAENLENFAITRAVIDQGRKENMINFAQTQGLINQGREENRINFQVTQGLVNQGRVENMINFKETQSLINEGRRENLLNFALTQDLVNQGRAENKVNFAVTQSLINRGREENQINFKITQGLINQGRAENLVNFGITQDLINQGRWENLVNFKAVQGSLAQLRDDTLRGFSFLANQADRNLEAIVAARVEAAQGFNNAYKLLDRNFDAVNTGRVENLRNFEITKKIINRLGDSILRNQAQAMIERMLFYTSTVNLIQSSANQTLNAIDDSRRQILRAIDKSRIEPILSRLTTFLNYFTSELEEIKTSESKQVLAKLQEPQGFLFYLVESRTPRAVNSLHSLLSDIINQGLAIPKSSDDELALMTLDALFAGTQAYASVLAFLMEAYMRLAFNHYQESDVEQFNSHLTLMNLRYSDFSRSLNNGILQQVEQILQRVQASKVIQDREELLAARLENLKTLKNSIVRSETNIRKLQTSPSSLQRKLEFNESSLPYGAWKRSRTVAYAIQYKFTDNTMSKVGSFSTEFTHAATLANPYLHVPTAPSGVSERLIFRRFDSDKPEYVGSVPGTGPTVFRDINKDLFNAAGNHNEALALEEVRGLLQYGANVSANYEDGKTALHKAAAVGNSRVVELLVQAGARMDTKDLQGYLPIHYGAQNGYVPVFEKLVSLNADVNAKTSSNLTPLHLAALYGHEDAVKYLLPVTGISSSAITKNGYTALHLSILAGHLATTNVLLGNNNVDVNAVDGNLLSPLHCAVAIENVPIAGLLISNERVQAGNGAGDLTELHLAAIRGNKDLIELLLTQPKVNPLATISGGFTPLHLAAVGGHVEAVRALLSRHTTGLVNARTTEKWTPLHVAVALKQEQVTTELLLQSDVDIHAKTEGGLTALHLAAGTDQASGILKLILLGAKVEEQTDIGLRPIHYAAWYGRKNAVSALLRVADVTVRTGLNLTPLHLAVIGNHLEVVELLTAVKEVSLNDAARNGVTPLHLAAATGRQAIVEHLLKKGADVNAKDTDGRTAWDLSVENGHKLVSKILESQEGISSKCLKLGDVNQNKGGLTLLHTAAFDGDLNQVQTLIKCGADINALTNYGSNALHEAAYQGRSAVVAALLDAGAEVNKKKTDGWAAIHLAAWTSVPTLEVLLAKGADINLLTDNRQTALDIATESGNHEVESFLRMRGAKSSVCIPPEAVNLRDDEGFTKLQQAARSGSLFQVKQLISCKADVHVISHIGSTALHEAAYHGRNEIVDELLKAGSNINQRKEDGWAAIHLAALAGHVNTVNLLLQKKADVNLATFHQETALDVALYHGKQDVADLLKQNGGKQSDCVGLKDLDALDSKGWNALLHAAMEGNSRKVKALIKCGASLGVFSSIGSLPIHEAAFHGHDEVVRELLAAGVDPNVRKKDGATSLHLAAIAGKANVAKVLLENGADVNSKAYDGLTALNYANSNGSDGVASILKRYGGVK